MLEQIDVDLFSSKFGRWFGSTYLGIKRILLLLAGIAIVVLATALLVYPEMLLEDPQFKKEVIQDSKDYYAEMAGFTFEETIVLLAKDQSGLTADRVFKHLDIAFGKAIEQEIISTIRFFAVLLLLLAFGLLYISRLTRKMRFRNLKITQSETLSQDLIMLFKEAIEEEEEELAVLREMVDRLKTG